jgi:HK97 family phage prohead protease
MKERTVSVRTAQLDGIEVRKGPQTGDGSMTIKGHAAVFNLYSLDLGGFREIIAPGAFTEVLSANPDVHLDWDHDTRYVLGRTQNKTLELREDEMGLSVFCRVAPVSYADDLAILMERGDINQMSFKFIPGEENWKYPEDPDDPITVEVVTVTELFDVCVCAQGAYPQTDATLARKRLENALEGGRVHGRANESPIAADSLGQGIAPIAALPGGTSSLTGEESERRFAERKRRLALAKANTQ